MPVEIKELVIRAVVDARASRDEAHAAADGDADVADTSRHGMREAFSVPDGGADTHEIIEECVRRVLEILKKSRER